MPAQIVSFSDPRAGGAQENIDGLDFQLIMTERVPEFRSGERFRERCSGETEVVTEDGNRCRLRILGR